jgi:hypothetical protein
MEKVAGSNPAGCTILVTKDNLMEEPHYHEDKESGLLVKCFNHCTNLLTDYRFWIGVTISYPLEHFLWEKVWPFSLVMHFLGL